MAVAETELGRIGMMICFDGDYPELARIQAVRGAQIICRPSSRRSARHPPRQWGHSNVTAAVSPRPLRSAIGWASRMPAKA